MLNNSEISIVIPCYNEERGLKYIFESMPNFIDEIIVVDNGSEDNTVQLAESYNAKVVIEKRRGYGCALLKGLSQVDGKIIAIIDGDGSYPVEILKEMCMDIEKNNFDFISGCRFPLIDFEAMPISNRFGNYFISWLVRFIFKIDIMDSMSGMMIFRKNILNKMKIYNRGMGFTQEIKIKAWLDPQINCKEFYIPYYPRIGRSKFKKMIDSIKVLYNVLILWIRLQRKKRLLNCVKED